MQSLDLKQSIYLFCLNRIQSRLNAFYQPIDSDSFICTTGSGMTKCSDIPVITEDNELCNGTMLSLSQVLNSSDTSNALDKCINWNMYYKTCKASDLNPFKNSISFDNIGYAWLTIFQVYHYSA